MAKCLQCGEILESTKGKRQKQFCNNTCRSNYWYAKNKRGKSNDVAAASISKNKNTQPQQYNNDPYNIEKMLAEAREEQKLKNKK